MITHKEMKDDLEWANINENLKNKLLNYIRQQEKRDELLGLYQTIYELEINGMLDGFYIEDVDDRANQNDLLLDKIKELESEIK